MSGFGQDAVPGHRRHRRPPLPVQLPVPEVPVQARPRPAVPVGRAQNRQLRRDRLVRKGFRRQGQPSTVPPTAGTSRRPPREQTAAQRAAAVARAAERERRVAGRAGRTGSLARRPGIRRVGPGGAGSLCLVGIDCRPDGRCAGSRGGLLAAPAARGRRLRVGLAGPVAGRTRPHPPAHPRVLPAGRATGRSAGDRPRPHRVHGFPGRCAGRAGGVGSVGGGLLSRSGQRVGLHSPGVVARQQIRPVGSGAVLRRGRRRPGFLAGPGHRAERRSALLSGARRSARGGRCDVRGRGPDAAGWRADRRHRRAPRPTAGRPRWPPIPGSTRSR